MPEWVLPAISSYGYAALFLAALVEGPMATVFGAILASQGLLHIGGVYGVAVAGDLVGDILVYGVGMSGRATHSLVGRRFNLSRYPRFTPLLAQFRTRPGRVLVTAKLTHAAGFLVLLSAGAARIPFWRFLGFNLLATLPKSGVLVLLGFFAGEAWHRIDLWLWVFSCSFLVLFGIAFIVYLRRVAGSVLPGG